MSIRRICTHNSQWLLHINSICDSNQTKLSVLKFQCNMVVSLLGWCSISYSYSTASLSILVHCVGTDSTRSVSVNDLGSDSTDSLSLPVLYIMLQHLFTQHKTLIITFSLSKGALQHSRYGKEMAYQLNCTTYLFNT